MIFLVAILARETIDVTVHVPYEICSPVVIISPQQTSYEFWDRRWQQIIYLNNLCGTSHSLRTCSRWWFECSYLDENNIHHVFVRPDSGIVCQEDSVVLESSAFQWMPAGTYRTRCELRTEACPLSDMTQDCIVTREDFWKILEGSVWNRLQLLQYFQNEWKGN